MESGCFNYFVRQFGGNGSPDVDKSFHTVNDIPGLKLSYKMVDAREYIAYPPLLVGFFQSSSHVVQIQQSFIGMLEKGLGRMGTYGGGWSIMSHRGSLFYLGPKKKGNMRQPTVSEGPNKPGITSENQFWFHWRHVSHKFWSFVHWFLNLIVSGWNHPGSFLYLPSHGKAVSSIQLGGIMEKVLSFRYNSNQCLFFMSSW